MKKLLIVILTAAALFTAAAGQGGVPEFVPDSAVIKAAATVDKAHFPEADNVLLRETERYTYNKNGSYQAADELYVKVLTEKGRASLRQLTFHFNLHYNNIKVEKLLLIKPDLRIVPVDIAANSRAVIDSSQMSSNIYDPAQRILTVSIPGLEEGDIIYLRSVDNHFKPRIPNFWSTYTLLQSSWPILDNKIIVDAPAELPLRSIALKDEVKGTVAHSVKKEKERIIYTWHAKNVPQVLHEPGMPELHTCVQRLLVSTAGSWEEVSKWYWELCRPRLEAVTPAMKAQTQALIKGKKEPLEQVKAIFQFVSQNIRYMGITPEKEAPGYEPHDVNLTFEQRYGVCRDKAALLVAMLKLANFKAYPVLFMAGEPKDDEIPNGYFNHAVTAVELKEGEFILMDPTYESTTELFPAFQADMSYLVAHPEGKKLKRSPIIPSSANKARIRTTGKISTSGLLSCESVIELSGVNDLYYRGAFSMWAEEKKEQFFLGRLRKVLPGVRLEKWSVTPADIRNMGENLKFKLNYTLPIDTTLTRYPLAMPGLSQVFGVGEAVFQDVELLKRKYPLRFSTTCSTAEEYEITLPPTMKILALPASVQESVSKQISFSNFLTMQGNVLKGKNTFDMNTLEVKASDYPQLKLFLNKFKKAPGLFAVAENNYTLSQTAQALKAFPGADSVVEKHTVYVNVKNANSWSVDQKIRRRILNYAGVKSHSELKIPYQPVRTEIASFDARVHFPDGKVKKIGKSEINVMDSPRNSAGPRYPAEKILVANLPGVTPGCVIEYEYKLEYKNRSVFHGSFLLADLAAPVGSAVVTLETPEKMYISSHVSGNEPVTTRDYEEKGRRFRVWSVKNLPRIKNEPNMPPWYLALPGVSFTAVEGNSKYAAAVNKVLREKCAASLPAAKALADKEKWHEITDRKEKILKVRNWVDKSIRKADMPLSAIPLEALGNAETILKSGYGNSAERAILTGALLKVLGIECRFTGVSPVGSTTVVKHLFSRNLRPENLSEEILVYIPSEKWYLNDTGRFAHPGSVNSENKIGIELETGRTITISSPEKNAAARRMKFVIDCKNDNSAVIKVTEVLSGREYETLKEEFETGTPERRRRFFEARATFISHSAVLKEPPRFDFKNYPGTLNYTLHVPEFLTAAGELRQMMLPGYSLLRKTAAFPPSGGKRKNPYWRNSAQQLFLFYVITPPAGWEALPGRKEQIASSPGGAFSFAEHCSILSGQITLQSRLYLPVSMVSAVTYAAFEEWARYIALPGSNAFMFQKTSRNQINHKVKE